MNNILDHLIGTIAPHICKGCGRAGTTLCHSCFLDIIEGYYRKCILCGAEISEETFAKNGNMCAACSRKLPCRKVWVVGERIGTMMHLVDEFKYNSERSSQKVISELLDVVVPKVSNSTVVTMIPTAPPHIRERGFDHAQLMAKGFAKRRELKFAKLLTRRSFESQHDKNARERMLLASKMFNISRKFQARLPQEVLLVDDIWTTGASTIAATKLLKSAGVESVDLAIIARQVEGVHHRDVVKRKIDK